LRLLLDSHVLLWAVADPARLAKPVRDHLRDAGNELLVSAASIWELHINAELGRLDLPAQFPDILWQRGFTCLAVDCRHGSQAARLPPHHADPFDRMLIAQAKIENLTIVTRDREFAGYGIAILPA
jgi:PIN domain nuclease of toxin-antitoxin system